MYYVSFACLNWSGCSYQIIISLSCGGVLVLEVTLSGFVCDVLLSMCMLHFLVYVLSGACVLEQYLVSSFYSCPVSDIMYMSFCMCFCGRCTCMCA